MNAATALRSPEATARAWMSALPHTLCPRAAVSPGAGAWQRSPEQCARSSPGSPVTPQITPCLHRRVPLLPQQPWHCQSQLLAAGQLPPSLGTRDPAPGLDTSGTCQDKGRTVAQCPWCPQCLDLAGSQWSGRHRQCPELPSLLARSVTAERAVLCQDAQPCSAPAAGAGHPCPCPLCPLLEAPPTPLLPEHGVGVGQTPARPSCGCWGSHLPRAQPLGAPVPARGWRWLVWGRRCAVAARLFCVSGQVSRACFTVGLSQSPQVMPRSQEHSTPAAGRVLAPGLAPGRVEAPPPQERALESWPWAEAGPAPAWGWTETHDHVVMGPGGIQETGLPCPLYLGSITLHPFPPSILGPTYPFLPTSSAHTMKGQQSPSLTSPSQTCHPHPPRLPSPAQPPPTHRWLQAGCSHSLFARFGCFTNNGVRGMGWGREGNSNGFGTSEKLGGTGSALQRSRAGDTGTGRGRCRAHCPLLSHPSPGPGAWFCSPPPQGPDWAGGQSQPRGRGCRGREGAPAWGWGGCRARGGMGWVVLAPDVGWQEVTFPPGLWGQMPCGTQPMPCSAAMGLQRCPAVDGAGEAPLPLAMPSQSPPSPALPLPEAVGAQLGLGTRVAPRAPPPPSPCNDSTGGKTAAWVVTGGQLGCHGDGGCHCSHKGNVGEGRP